MKIWRKPTILDVVLLIVAITVLIYSFQIRTALTANLAVLDRIESLEQCNRHQFEFNQHILDHLTNEWVAATSSW